MGTRLEFRIRIVASTRCFFQDCRYSTNSIFRASAVCAGRAQPSMLSTINVDYYGAPTPLQSLASVSAPDASTLMIKPFDKSGIKVSFRVPSFGHCLFHKKKYASFTPPVGCTGFLLLLAPLFSSGLTTTVQEKSWNSCIEHH